MILLLEEGCHSLDEKDAPSNKAKSPRVVFLRNIILSVDMFEEFFKYKIDEPSCGVMYSCPMRSIRDTMNCSRR